jgi:ZIP family zinc transporter
VLGAAVAWFVHVPRDAIATIMAFGSGVLISAVAFDLMETAADTGGGRPAAIGALAGALIYLGGSTWLARRGARHRKRSGQEQPSEEEQSGSGSAIALGALLDGIPESAVLGIGLITGGTVSVSMLAAVVISNVPEGLSSSARYVFGVWGAIALLSGVAALIGYAALGDASPQAIALVTAIAAGAILTMIADTMIPEAFERTKIWTGVIMTVGFLVAFAIDRAA